MNFNILLKGFYMYEILVEFINICFTCNGYSSYLNKLRKEYKDKLEIKLYYAETKVLII